MIALHGQPATYLYATSAIFGIVPSPGSIYQYKVAPDGSLVPMGVASVQTGVGPGAMTADPSGQYVYVVNRDDATISQYAIGSGGELSPLSPSAVTSGLSPSGGDVSVAADPTGHFLYAVFFYVPFNGPSAGIAVIAQYSIGGGGALTPLATPTVSVLSGAIGSLVIDPSGRYAYLASSDSSASVGGSSSQVAQFSISSDGTLQPLSPAIVAAPPNAFGMTISPDDRMAYVLSFCVDAACDGQVTPYTIGSSGALVATTSATTTGSHVNPVAMLIDTMGTSAYLLTNLMGVDTSTSSIYQYTINSTGTLTADSPASLGVAPGTMAVSSDGSNLYTLSSNALIVSGGQSGGHIDRYTMGAGGLLTAAGTTSIANGLPTAMTVATVN